MPERDTWPRPFGCESDAVISGGTIDIDALPGHDDHRVRFAEAGLWIVDVQGCYEPHPWSTTMPLARWGLMLVRSGAYARRGDGVEQVVDRNTGFFRRPGMEHSVAHFTGRPDVSTCVYVDEAQVDDFDGLVGRRGPIRVSPHARIAHGMMRRAVADHAGVLAVQEALVSLVAELARTPDSTVGRRSRRSTETSRRRLAHDACEVLNTEPEVSLTSLARRVGSSPWHLSRTFHEVIGTTISQYRTALRVHDVLECLSDGADDLAMIASRTGFADHSHMTRTIVAHVGQTPSELRRLLGPRQRSR